MNWFSIRIVYLNGTYHGRRGPQTPEWPPSPLRLVQALVAAAGQRLASSSEFTQALEWLCALPAPEIVAPECHLGRPYQVSVPNNAMDIVAKAWSRGNESGKDARPATHRTMKTVRSSLLSKTLKESEPVVYLWRLDPSIEKLAQQRISCLGRLAADLTAVGWGVDLVAGHAALIGPSERQSLPGDCWRPVSHGSITLRCPTPKSVGCLRRRHDAYLHRLARGRLTPIPPLSPEAYQVMQYKRDFDPVKKEFAAFSFLDLDGNRMRAFRKTQSCSVAGMLRHAAANMARQAGWDERTIASFILGHRPDERPPSTNAGSTQQENARPTPVGPNRLAYVPLPSIERRGDFNAVGLIRRCLLFVPGGGNAAELNRMRRMLSGSELIDEHRAVAVAFMSALPGSDKIVGQYTAEASTWSTVTPVVLPGRDDHKDRKTAGLIRKAIVQAGYSEALAENAIIDWSKTGFWPGAEHADRYFLPKHLMGYPCYHVRIRWRNPDNEPLPIPGPIVIGGGRYYGLGAFVREVDEGPV